MSNIKMTVGQCKDLGLWDKYWEWIESNKIYRNTIVSDEDIIEFDSQFKPKENTFKNPCEIKNNYETYVLINKEGEYLTDSICNIFTKDILKAEKFFNKDDLDRYYLHYQDYEEKTKKLTMKVTYEIKES